MIKKPARWEAGRLVCRKTAGQTQVGETAGGLENPRVPAETGVYAAEHAGVWGHVG